MRKHHYVGDPKPICICDALRQADATGYGRAVTEFLEKGYVYKSEHEQAIKEAERLADVAAVAVAYEQGQRDALAAAAQRVEALCVQHGYDPLLRHYVIAAIKGES